MKIVLDPKIKKDQIISVQYSSRDKEEDKKSKKLESTLNQVLNDIDQSLRKVPDLVPKNCLTILMMKIWKEIQHHCFLK